MELTEPEKKQDILEDGIDLLPQTPGIYVIMNRVTKMCFVGSATNLRNCCAIHKSTLLYGAFHNKRLRNDAAIYGGDVYFFFAPVKFDSVEHAAENGGLDFHEFDQILLFSAHEEVHGFNNKLFGTRTWTSKFRKRERKLMLRDNYFLLDGVDLYAPINRHILGTWLSGS